MTPRRIVSTILILALVIVGGISVPYVIEVVKVRSLRRAWAERVAALEARGVPLTLDALEASLPPPPPEAEDGAPLLREAVRLYDERWPDDGGVDAEPPIDVLYRYELASPSTERAELWAALQAAVPDLESLWARVDEALTSPHLHGEFPFLTIFGLLRLREALCPEERAHAARMWLFVASRHPTCRFGMSAVSAMTHRSFEQVRGLLVQDFYLTGADDLIRWAVMLDDLETRLPAHLAYAITAERISILAEAESSPEVVVRTFYGMDGPIEGSTYWGQDLEGHALARLCREFDAADRLEGGIGDEARLRVEVQRARAEALPTTQATRPLAFFFRALTEVRLMRVRVAIAVDRRAGRAPAESLERLAQHHGFDVPLDPTTGEPLGYELREDVVRIGFQDRLPKKPVRFAWDIPRWDREPEGEAGNDDDDDE